MPIFIIIGFISLITGVLLIFAPEVLRKLNGVTSSLVSNIEKTVFSYRMGFGLTLFIASLLFFFVAYYIKVKG